MASPNLAVSGQIGRRAVKSAQRVVEAPIALRFQPGGAAAIAGQLFWRLVRYTIDLDHELRITTTEVRKVEANRHLPGKLHVAELPIAQARPKSGFRHCLLAPE